MPPITHRGLKMLRNSIKAGFTLLEMMVVILIIGVLAAVLLPNVFEAMGTAKTSACEMNMRRLYELLIQYKIKNKDQFPRDEGQKFILRLWGDRVCEHTEQNARRFFCVEDPLESYVAVETGETFQEYLESWKDAGPDFISYAGFTSGGDRKEARKLLRKGNTTIVACGHLSHRDTVVYMTANGDVHRLKVSDLLEDGLLTEADIEDQYLPLGPSSPIEALRTVTSEY